MQGIDATQFASAGGEAALAHVTALKDIQPPEVRQAVLRAYGDSLRVVWIVATPIAAFGLLCSFVIKVYSLTNKESTKHDPEKNAGLSQENSSSQSDSQATLQNDQNAAERSAQRDPAATTTVPEIIEEEPLDDNTVDRSSRHRAE